jgi:predicted Fe-Mo cluster-binding NifX family protein
LEGLCLGIGLKGLVNNKLDIRKKEIKMKKIKLAIATDGNIVAGHFGRCATYTLVDIEDNKEVERKIIENPGHVPGAIPKLLNSHNANYVVSGGMGQRAQTFFAEYGIEPILGIEGEIDTIIEQFLKGTLIGGESSCVSGAGKGIGIEKTVCDHHHDSSESHTEKQCAHNKTDYSKIAITSQGPNLDSDFDERFGRCQYFIVIDTSTDNFESIQNESNSASGGAGTASAKKIADLGVQAVISGHFGPNAATALQAFGIKMHTSKSETISKALAEFKNGSVQEVTDATVASKTGL